MSVYYLLEEDYKRHEIGEILDVNKDEVKIFGLQRKTSIRIENAKVIPLNSKEANFYVKFDKHKRLVAYKNKLLDKCSQLTEGAKADVTVNYQRHRVIIKEITNENMTLICDTEKGKSIKFDVPDISDIVIGESREMGLVVRESRDSLNGRYTRASMEEGYYILCEQIKEFRPGMIIRVGKSGIRTYPDNESIRDIDELIDKVDKIEKYEADALKNSSFATRVKGHRAYSQIKIGGQCYYRVLGKEVLCSIVAKDIQYKGIKLDLLSETKQEHKGVGLSEIRLFDSTPNDANDSLKSLRQIDQNSGRLVGSHHSSTGSIPNNVTKTIPCDPIGIDVINPQFDNKFDGGCTPTKKILVVRFNDNSFIVTLLWRGKINDEISLGCALITTWTTGTNGTFNGVTLFNCEDKRGILIPFNESIKTCGFDHQHINVKECEIIDESQICCVETKESLASVTCDMDKIMILKSNRNIKGKLKWKGLINGIECVGINPSNKNYSMNKKSGTLINQMKLCAIDVSSLIMLNSLYIDEEKLHFINDTIVDSERIYSAESLTNYNVKGIKIGDPVTVNGINKEFIGELKWFGMINNNNECAGVDMEQEIEYGMDGTIHDKIRFDCLPKHGLITLYSNLKLYKYDQKLETFENGMINPNKYIKFEVSRNPIEFNKKYKINKDNSVRIKIKNKKDKIIGLLRWQGLMNGIRVGAVELAEDHSYGTNGMFWRKLLFTCKEKRAVAVHCDSISPYSPIEFDKTCFVVKSYQFRPEEISRERHKYKVGELLKANLKANLDLYGEVEFFINPFGKILVGLRLDDDQISKHTEFLKDKLVGKPYFLKEGAGIIVKEKVLEKFKEEIKCLPNAKFINMDSVKYKKISKSNQFQENDIVKIINDESTLYKITNLFELNEIHCLEVQEAILPSEYFYLKEREVIKIHKPEIETPIVDGVFFNPLNIVTFEKYTIGDDLQEGYRVEFRSNDYSKLFNGLVKFVGKINYFSCCVVELACDVDKEILNYKINEIKILKKLYSITNGPTVIVLAHVLRKVIRVLMNDIYILDPSFVTQSKGNQISDKTIVLKNQNKNKLLKVKWKGMVNKMHCLGCENTTETRYGTNGTFGKEQLFKCRNQCGFLIRLEDLEECCEQFGHQDLKKNPNKYNMIEENCICCVTSVDKLNGNKQMKINCLIERATNEYFTCRWIGLINNVEVIGAEYGNKQKSRIYKTLCGIQFEYQREHGGLFEASEFRLADLEFHFLNDVHLRVISPFSIKLIDYGESVNKSVIRKIENKTSVLNLKWKGHINGRLCFGLELDTRAKFGTDGNFLGKRLFTCENMKGFVIPFEELKGSCESDSNHQEIILHNDGFLKNIMGLFITNDNKFVDENSICCVESLSHINGFPELRLGSRIKYKRDGKDIGGICEWMGLINGKSVIGARMDEGQKGSNGLFYHFKLFNCPNGKGFLFLADDICHDTEKEKVYFINDTIVDSDRIYSAESLTNYNDKEINIGDPVTVNLRDGNGINKEFIGEFKWIGMINNNNECAGVDMEQEIEYGMDGTIHDKIRFDCLPKHGLITLYSNLNLYKYDQKLETFENGMINPNKYIKVEEKFNIAGLTNKEINKNKAVYIKLKCNDGKRKMKGTLKWFGLMNGIGVGGVELNADHEYGTNGTFWRNRLFVCSEHRAVAVLLENIDKYIPFEEMIIPDEHLIFKELNINSAVTYYLACNKDVINQYGTIRWSGVDENDEYFYGIELDDRINNGTDGTFKEQRLFQCRNGHGILAPINAVVRDTRFTEIDVTPDDVEKSKESACCQLSVLKKLSDGLQKGIQGNANSCYFDSAIFALFVNSDVLDFMISPIINDIETIELTKNFRKIMSWKIIYPLREYGFVSFHRTEEMREVIKQYGSSFAEMTKQETDMGNVSILLSKLCPTEQLLKIVSQNECQTTSMFLQLFLTLGHKPTYMTTEEMINLSMIQNGIMFAEHPTCLIAQAPRDARGINCYEYVLPSDIIEISHICSNNWKKCKDCDSEAIYQCTDCVEENELNIQMGFHCAEHSCKHKNKIQLNTTNARSRSKVLMELKAIICIEKCHFVSYVKQVELKSKKIKNELSQKKDFIKKWFFFDSMSTQSAANNYAIPRVTQSKDVSNFMNLKINDMKQELSLYKTTELKRIINDSYVFIYHNLSKTCY